MRRFGRRAAIVSTALSVLLVAGVAFAAWTASGTGSGTAGASSAQPLTTTAAATTTQLYPGGTGDLKITINNTNPYPVLVTSLDPNGAITSDKGSNCDSSTGVTYSEPSTLSLAVPANGSATHTLSGAMSMGNASHNDCQGAVFTVPLTITGASDAS